MYEKFFYLKENPFHITPDPKYLYLSKRHAAAMELMRYGVERKKGFIMLTGEVGTGKTTLCRALLAGLSTRTESALILNPLVSGRDLLRTITQDFGLRVEPDTVKGHLDALNDFLLDTARRGADAVIIIDESQNLSHQALEMLRLLSNLETESEKLLQIVMVGQPELRTKLGVRALRQLNQRIVVRHRLEPLDWMDTGAYIESRLRVAGADSTVSFSQDAVNLVHRASTGIPRMINIICDRALTAAFISSDRSVGAAHVVRAIDELTSDGYLNAPGARPATEHVGQATGPVTGLTETADAGVMWDRAVPFIAATTFLAALMAGLVLGSAILGGGVWPGLVP